MTWGDAIFRLLGLLLVVQFARYAYLAQWTEVGRVVVQGAFFYVLWLIVEYVKAIIRATQEAFRMIEHRDKARMQGIADIKQVLGDQQTLVDTFESRIQALTDTFEERQLRIASVVATKTDETTKIVDTKLESIRGTIEKVATDHDEFLKRLNEIFKEAWPPRRLG